MRLEMEIFDKWSAAFAAGAAATILAARLTFGKREEERAEDA
jgi:hypothetical protein